MKYRKILFYLFGVLFIISSTAFANFLYHYINHSLPLSPYISLVLYSFALFVSFTSLIFLFSNKGTFLTIDKLSQENDELKNITQQMQGSINTKDLLLAKEKEILVNKHKKLEEALGYQKRINQDLDRLKRDYEKIISLNNYIWFMKDPHDILEEIAQHSIEAVNARKSVILINDEEGFCTLFGTSVCPEEDRKYILPMLHQQNFSDVFQRKLTHNRFLHLEITEIPDAVLNFFSMNQQMDYYGFPIFFRNSFRGVAFFCADRKSQDFTLARTTIEMFLSIVSVYFERNELIDKEMELDNVLSEKEKLMSITNLIEGIAHNINSPLNTVMLSQELLDSALVLLKDSDVPEDLIERLQKTAHRIRKAATKINNIVTNLTKKSMMDKVEKSDYISLNDLLSNELQFLEADMEFKHNHQKEISLAENLPVIWGLYRDYSYFIESIIYISMYMYMLKDIDTKKINFTTGIVNDRICFDVGLDPHVDKIILENILNGSFKQHLSKLNLPSFISTMKKYHIEHTLISYENMLKARFFIPQKKK